jgi:hypothetical protein
VEPLGRTSTRALHSLLSGQPNTTAKVAFAWTIAAGPALGRASTPTWSVDGTLVVRAADERWRRELDRARPLIAERLGQLLGPDVVKKIVIR